MAMYVVIEVSTNGEVTRVIGDECGNAFESLQDATECMTLMQVFNADMTIDPLDRHVYTTVRTTPHQQLDLYSNFL